MKVISFIFANQKPLTLKITSIPGDKQFLEGHAYIFVIVPLVNKPSASSLESGGSSTEPWKVLE
jgi:hypothetical protein